MRPWYDSGGVAIHVGHVLDVLAGLPAGSVQCCVTSPPYFGLRSYQTEPQIWGGDPLCSHSLEAAPPGKVLTGGTGTASAKQVSNVGSQYGNAWESNGTTKGSTLNQDFNHRWNPDWAPGGKQSEARPAEVHHGATCTRCSAWMGELGSEPNHQMYVEHIVEVFRAVRRVLHDTGTLWVNLGDSYSGSGKGPTGHNGIGDQGQRQGFVDQRSDVAGLGPKQLLMMPARVALALQADHWILRSDITWGKLAPMPESVRDRPTNATEHIFLLTKKERYFYDAEAVRQPYSPMTIDTPQRQRMLANGKTSRAADFYGALTGERGGVGERMLHLNESGANLRNLWVLGPEPQGIPHFATFVSEIPRRAILAGSRPGDVVLDPFCGSGTTLWVARQHFRRAIGIELSEEYARLSADRLKQSVLPFVETL